jgi:alanine racemase
MFAPRANIDLDAVVDNWRMLQRRAGRAEAAAVVKADAYGLGAARVGRALVKAGCKRFYVAWPREGAELRRTMGSGCEIAVFHGPTAGTLHDFSRGQLEPVLNSLEQIDLWTGGGTDRGPAAIHVDTGMNRLGLPEAVWAEAARRLPKPSRLISHLACADEPGHAKNREQLEAFNRARALWPGTPRSFSATGGVYLGADYAMEEIRPGIGLYGGGPVPTDGDGPKTVVSLNAPILQIRNVKRGETAGYGATWTADGDKTLATVGLGYADGFLRGASNTGMGVVARQRRPIIGRISMDLIVVDVTGLKVSLGDEIEFLGPNMPLTEVADSMGTIDYELLTRIGSRVWRVWTGGE